MSIDSSKKLTLLEAEESGKAGAGAASGVEAGELATNKTALSSDQARVVALAAQIVNLPEIRSEKIARIASALHEGKYQVSPEQTAEAMIAELQGRSSVAA